MFCKKCGKEIEDGKRFCPFCGTPTEAPANPPQPIVNIVNVPPQPVKTTGSITRLVLGIILIVLAVIAFFQSCAVTGLEVVGAAFGNEATGSGIGGVLISLLMLAGGIVMVCTRKGKVGGIVAGAILILTGIIGIAGSADFGDLGFYGWVSIIFGLVSIIVSAIWGGKGKKV